MDKLHTFRLLPPQPLVIDHVLGPSYPLVVGFVRGGWGSGAEAEGCRGRWLGKGVGGCLGLGAVGRGRGAEVGWRVVGHYLLVVVGLRGNGVVYGDWDWDWDGDGGLCFGRSREVDTTIDKIGL